MLLSCFLSPQFLPQRAEDLQKAAELEAVRGEDGSEPKLARHSGGACVFVRVRAHTRVCVCGKRRTRERPRCLCSDSVFAVGHSIFLKKGGEILDSDQILTE